MKRKITVLLLSLLLLPALCVPALAAIEYGVFYDETEQLGSVELSYAAEQTLPRLTQELGVDLRVDAFTDDHGRRQYGKPGLHPASARRRKHRLKRLSLKIKKNGE